jgi:hypothetical protein
MTYGLDQHSPLVSSIIRIKGTHNGNIIMHVILFIYILLPIKSEKDKTVNSSDHKLTCRSTYQPSSSASLSMGTKWMSYPVRVLVENVTV